VIGLKRSSRVAVWKQAPVQSAEREQRSKQRLEMRRQKEPPPASPQRRIQCLEIGPVGIREFAIGAVVHDRELRLFAERSAWKAGLQVREKMPQAENVSNLVNESIDAFLRRLLEHRWIDEKRMLPRVREERAREHTTVGRTLRRSLDSDFEVDELLVFDELNGRGVTPGENRGGKQISQGKQTTPTWPSFL